MIYRHSWLGSGIKLDAECEVSDFQKLRPIKIDSDVDKLRGRTKSQFEYGLLCAIAPSITFELETSAPSSELAAAESWNNQYALIFLSIVARTFVFQTIQVSGGYQSNPTQHLAVSYPHGIPHLQSAPKRVTPTQINNWVRLLPNFIQLLKIERFQIAASIAATVYVHPRTSIQVTSIFSAIEALLDVEQELKFRIALSISKLLAKDPVDRVALYRKMKKLYDIRSKCVHGGKLSKDSATTCRDDSLEILRQLIIVFAEKNELPSKEDLEEMLAS